MNDRAHDLAVLAKKRATGAEHDSRTAPGGMIDHGLDLAVIGNGRTAALVDPCSRIVWWCYPRFDGEPIFCRLLSGREDRPFTSACACTKRSCRDDIPTSESRSGCSTMAVDCAVTEKVYISR